MNHFEFPCEIIGINNSKEMIYNMEPDSPFTNLGFKLAYFLWIMKGSNRLEDLSFYSDHVNKMTDDFSSLRGGYGPRINYWVGADQLQECINSNSDIENPEDFKKPLGVNQLNKIFNDLKNGLDCTCCQIFDPSIDFEDSNYIPNLLNLMFYKKENNLNMNATYSYFMSDSNEVNDIFMLKILHFCMASVLNLNPDKIIIVSAKSKFNHTTIVPKIEESVVPNNIDPDSLISDLSMLDDFERHFRNTVNPGSIINDDVDIIKLSSNIINKFLSHMQSRYWKEYGLTLASWILIKYGKSKYIDHIEENILPEIKGGFRFYIQGELENVRNTR